MTQDFEDHPRLCGEKAITSYVQTHSLGSPPPMRGKVTVQSDAVNHGGITPAYAGKSPRILDQFMGQRDHPRLCGEKLWN